MKSVRYLEQLQQKLGKATQQEMADLLGITQGAVGHYLHGRRIMDDETCLAVAMQLNIDPLQVVGAACIDRAEKAGQPSLWTVFMERAAATAAIAVLATGVNLFLTPDEAKASTYKPYSNATTPESLYYVK
jgi:transcriptional regulator with XRE-family HTH domain